MFSRTNTPELPSISIVIITHNEEKNIGDCLASLDKLDYPPHKYEIIVVDSSSDKTKEIATKNNNVKIIHSDKKYYPIVRNKGVHAAKYKFIAFTDADCIIPSEWIHKLIPAFENENIAAVGGNAYPPPNTSFLGKCIACLGKPAGGAIGLDSELKETRYGVDFLATCNSIFRKNIILQLGCFDERLLHGDEDTELCSRITRAGYILKYEPTSFVYHKTRDKLSAFFKWAFKRGQGTYLADQSSLKNLLLSPFSPIWPIIGLTAMTLLFLYLPLKTFIVFFLASNALFIGTFIVIYSYDFFPTGRRKLKLLIHRRKRINVKLLQIIFIIFPLFYIDRMIMNLGSIYEAAKKIA